MERLKAYMARMFRVFVGREAAIFPIPVGSDDLGFTTNRSEIYIGFEHPLVKKLSEKMQNVFLIGVFAHEMLHQIFTDFVVLERALCEAKSDRERKIISLLSNIVEDPYIEYHAPSKIGGSLLKALRFSIRWVYSCSGSIKSDSAFTELCNGLINFGDMGLLRGSFTEKETFRIFREIAPEFNNLIKQSTPEERVAAAVRWTELTRPLWDREEDIDDTVEKIKSSNGISSYGDTGEPENDGNGSGDPKDTSPEEKRRDQFSEMMERDEKETGENCEGHEQPDENSSEKKTEQTENKQSEVEENGTDETDKPGGGVGALFSGEDTGNEILFDEIDLYDEDIDKIEKDLENAKDTKTDERPFIQDLDFQVTSGVIRSATCLNHRLMTGSESAKTVYNRIVKENENYITDLVRYFRRIFVKEEPDMIRSTSGYYNVKRAGIGTSAKIFDKRKRRETMDDLSIFILVDESGSMQGEKIEMARKTAIILSEVFARLILPGHTKIPLYVMGFTADTEGRDIIQDHFITWTNTSKERYSLSFLQAKANNCDGYSIRYASRLLSQRKSDHKLMFIVSDGLPACRKYPSMKMGLSDTAEAIREAKKQFSVVGIGLGRDCNPAVLQKLYTDSFLYVRSAEDLTKKMVEVLMSLVKKF